MSYLLAFLRAYGKTPIVLVEFERAGVTYRYALAKRDYLWNGQTWRASSLDFSELNYTDEIKKDDFTLKNLLRDDPDFPDLTAVRDDPLKLTLRRGFVGVEEFIVVYKGQLSSTIPHRASVDLVFSSWSKALSRREAGFVAGRQCPWRLYSSQCGVNRATYATAGTATTYDAGVVTIGAASAQADGYYAGGLVQFDDDFRMIVRHVGSSLTLSGSFPRLADAVEGSGAAAVTIFPGCDKSLTTCRNRFNNIARNGSFPVMSDNPFTTRMN